MLRKKADIAGAGMDKSGSGSTAQAARELSVQNMTMGNELSTTVSVWDTQVKTVLQMCAHVSNHLDYSKKAHTKDDEYLAASLRHRDGAAVPVSEISKYVTTAVPPAWRTWRATAYPMPLVPPMTTTFWPVKSGVVLDMWCSCFAE